MRIVAVADTHLFHDELRVPEGDLFVHAGDLCRGGTLDELERGLAWVRSLPHRFKVLVAGNHDWAFAREPAEARALAAGAGVLYLEDGGAEVGGLRVWGSPWQPTYYDWAFNLPRGRALAEKWARVPPGLDLLVTHGPPAGVGDRSSMGGRSGCDDLRARIAEVRPRVHLFGHIHEDGGAWAHEGTLFVNCTTWECERAPTVLDVEVTPGEARVVSSPPPRR
ncbi:MAG TPA: metallophosphatase domain-containing protein [Polyangiaceae bacterium]|nr:metallophosphatase domain-containing protein [Polyangiaceae bacterium]